MPDNLGQAVVTVNFLVKGMAAAQKKVNSFFKNVKTAGSSVGQIANIDTAKLTKGLEASSQIARRFSKRNLAAAKQSDKQQIASANKLAQEKEKNVARVVSASVKAAAKKLRAAQKADAAQIASARKLAAQKERLVARTVKAQQATFKRAALDGPVRERMSLIHI